MSNILIGKPTAPLTWTDLKHRMWRQGNLQWKLDPLQVSISKAVYATNARKVCILSSRQIGKSYWAVVFALEFLIKNPGKIVRIIAPTLTACNDIVNDNLNAILEDCPPDFIVRRKSEMRWSINPEAGKRKQSTLRLGALEREYVDKNRGGNASIIIYEECGFVRGDDFNYGVNSVLGPQLLRSAGREIFVSTPSEDPEHPLHTRIKPEAEALGTFFSYTLYDSPSITQEMVDAAITRCGGTDTDDFQREYLARIIRPSSFMVVPPYDEVRHVAPFDPPLEAHWTVTIDWGGVRDLTVALFHTWDFASARHLIWDEQVFAPNTSTDHIVDRLKEWERKWHNFRVQARYADVFSQTSIDMYNMQYPTMVPPKGQWLAMVNGMVVHFSTDTILIHPRCNFLRRSLRSGLFNKRRDDFDRSPELGHMDALAALMYAVRGQSRVNPYTGREALPANIVVPYQHKTEQDKLAESLNPGGNWDMPRTFGAFRK